MPALPRVMPALLLLLGALLDAGTGHAETALRVERLSLEAADEQAYNYQEQGDWRVWARSATGFRQSRIWLQQRRDGHWLAPQPAPFSEARYRDSDPFLSADGQRLIFVSDRPAAPEGPPGGQLDLFESRRQAEGGWGPPQRLGEALQSPAYELGPELHGDTLWFASQRPGAPGRLSLYRAAPETGAPRPLPAPINGGPGSQDSDPTLSPDGRYLLWWSNRSGQDDLYLAERVGPDFGPPLRLPEPINSAQGTEFTPWISADGAWLHFASTRPVEGVPAGLAKTYRTAWPALLSALGPAAQAHSQAALDAAVSRFWRALGHGPGQGSDVETLAALLHPEARIWGSQPRARQAGLSAMSGTALMALLSKPAPRPLQECELERRQGRYGAMAWVYSRVRSDREAGSLPYTGVNSMQWQLGPAGWQLLSLHYGLDLPGEPLPAEGHCLD